MPPDLYLLIDKSFENIRMSEFFDEEMRIELCLNDGSYYPKLVETVMGVDIIRAFSNKSVVHGKICSEGDCMFWRTRKVKFSQWFTHSLIHNLQFHKHGFWCSNPVGGHPDWKWEGYAEYISLGKNKELTAIIEKSINPSEGKYEWIETDIDMGTTVQHMKFLAMTKYCFEVKKMDYSTFFLDSQTEENLFKEMMEWYEKIK